MGDEEKSIKGEGCVRIKGEDGSSPGEGCARGAVRVKDVQG